MPLLDSETIAQQRSEIDPEWKLKDGFLERELRFSNFVEAFSFMSAVALYAEKYDHHPNWSNVYHTVTIALSTHSANGITEKDFTLAKAIDKVANRYSLKGR